MYNCKAPGKPVKPISLQIMTPCSGQLGQALRAAGWTVCQGGDRLERAATAAEILAELKEAHGCTAPLEASPVDITR